jgi:hypothetical protein
MNHADEADVVAAEVVESEAGSRSKPPWYNNRFIILTLVWCVIGPFAIPILWFSSAFSIKAKLLHTIGILLVSAFIVGGLWWSWVHTYKPLLESQ